MATTSAEVARAEATRAACRAASARRAIGVFAIPPRSSLSSAEATLAWARSPASPESRALHVTYSRTVHSPGAVSPAETPVTMPFRAASNAGNPRTSSRPRTTRKRPTTARNRAEGAPSTRTCSPFVRKERPSQAGPSPTSTRRSEATSNGARFTAENDTTANFPVGIERASVSAR